MNYNELDLNLIKTFLTVFETKSILNASKKLYISQPAVSNSIKKLETFLGGQLFVRTSKGVVPTAEGKEFNCYCYNAMNIIKNGINNFSLYAKLNTGTINIGSSSTIIRKLLLPFMYEFGKKYPQISIAIIDANSEKLINLTKRGEVDLAILNTPVNEQELFEVTEITTTNDCFIANKDFEKEFLTIEELKQNPIILQKRPSNNRDYFDELCFKNNIDINPNYEIGSFGLITDFVEKGFGIAFTVKDFIKDDLQKGRVKVVETDLKVAPRKVVAITPQISTNSFACKTFISEMVEYFKQV